MAKKKRVDPIKQREKRAKVAAIVGVIVLALVAAYEIPTVMKATKSPPPPVRSSAGSTDGSSTAEGLPNITSGASGSVPTSSGSSGQLVDTDLPPPSADGQLVSFNVFATKNPFSPQVSTAPGASATTTTPSSTSAQGPAAPGSPTSPTPAPTVPGPTVVPPAQGPATTTTTAAQPAVAISVNGVVSHVASQGTFPAGAPVFRLASWTHDSAQVAIVGGSYASGGATLTLHVGQALTLENQSDGKRYKLELLSTP
jgi:hypothetical protein